MDTLGTLKEKLYFIKTWYKDIFTYPRSTIAVDESLDYDRYWEVKRKHGQIGHLSDWQKMRADIILGFLGRKDPSRSAISVGDIGCGEGSILKYIQDRFPLHAAVGYDSSGYVLEKAQSIGVDTVQLDINDERALDLIKETDYTLLLEVLEHTPHSEKILRAAYRKSQKGVFFSFPNTGYFIYRLRLLFGRFPKQWINLPNEHLRFWTAKDLRWWLTAQGYRQYEIFFYKGIPFLSKILPSIFAAGFVVALQKAQPL